MLSSPRLAPPDPNVTELLGTFSHLTQQWENGNGTVTVIGHLDQGQVVRGVLDVPGELEAQKFYRFCGRWDDHPKWGWQFHFSSFIGDSPTDNRAVISYLVKWCPGVGTATAQKLVEAYGENAVRVLACDPDRITSDGLLKPEVATKAAQALKTVCDPALRDAHLELHRLFRGHGFYGSAVKACLRRWKGRAPQYIRRDPFILLTNELPGCGFCRCDKLYSSLGLNPARLKRQGLAAWYALRQRDGDTWLALEDALNEVRKHIAGCDPRERRAVAMMIKARWLTYRMDQEGGHWIAEREKAKNELDCALCLGGLRKRIETGWPTLYAVGDHEINSTPSGWADSLSEHQATELGQTLTASRVVILTGSPGTGKTYTAAAVIQAMIKLVGRNNVAVAAPTGKAAVRISEKMQEAGLGLQSTTIHKLLRVKQTLRGGWSFEHHQDNPLPHRVIVVDEVSMMDVDLAASLLRACGRDCHLLLVGDKYQLPPVGHGAFLRDLIDAGVPTARLTEIRRNAGRIVHTCAAIKDGKLPELPDSLDCFPEENLVHLNIGRNKVDGASKMQQMQDELNAVYDWVRQQAEWKCSCCGYLNPDNLEAAPNPPSKCEGIDGRCGSQDLEKVPRWDLIDSVQVICARNTTRRLLNRKLQASLNPLVPGVHSPHRVFRVADKVICLKNGMFGRADITGKPQQEYVANGDIGRVEGFRGRQMLVRLRSPERLVAVPLGKEREDSNGQDDAPEGEEASSVVGCAWDLAYCCTVHKYQGSECPVVIFLAEGAGKLGSRELIYTALSRARELCVVIGERAELSRYVRNCTLPDRKTMLVELIQGKVQP